MIALKYHDDGIIDMFAAHPWPTVALIAVVAAGLVGLAWVAR